MADLEERFRAFDRVEPPDLWEEAERRAPRSQMPGEPRPIRRLAVAALALAVAAAGLGLAVRAIGGGAAEEPGATGTSASPTTRPTPTGGTPTPVPGSRWAVSTVVKLPGISSSIVPGPDGALYIAVMTDAGSRSIVRWDPSDGSTAMSSAIPKADRGVPIAFAGGSVWGAWGSDLYRLDPSSLQIVQQVAMPSAPNAVATAPDGSLWVGIDGQISVIDPGSGETLHGISVRGTPRFITFDPSGTHAYVVTDAPAGRDGEPLLELDASSGQEIASAAVGYRDLLGPSAIAATDAGVWVSYPTGMAGQVEFLAEGTLEASNVAAATGAQESAPSNQVAVSAAGGLVWVSDQAGGTLACVDPTTRDLLDRFAVAPSDGNDLLGRLVAQGGSVLYMDGSQSLLRLDPPSGCRVSG